MGNNATKSRMDLLDEHLANIPELFGIVNGLACGPVRNIRCVKGGPIRETILFADHNDRFSIGFEDAPAKSESEVHRHEHSVEYYLVISGKVGCAMKGFKKVARPGEHIFIPKNTPHKAVALTDCIFLAITIPAAPGMTRHDT